ncbi:ABC transporter ATP-binding protein [Streptomyces sp. CB01580]|uniref:ABC transporter ATP-binding protein n=1 Tax=Streptomyces sp. CB01580 TaxID=1703933 RepID=UPI00093E772B|nr:ABC transporter ATP-binding protein [Streptomyces sp. CB01580]
MTSEKSTGGLRLLWDAIGSARRTVVGGFAILAVALVCDLAGPLVIRAYVDGASGSDSVDELMRLALIYLGIAAVGVGANLLAGYLAARSGWGVADTIRRRLLRKVVVDRPVLEVERRSAGEVLESVEGNADVIGEALAEAGFRVMGNLALALGTVVIIFTIAPAAGAGVAVLLVIITLVLAKLTRLAVRRWQTARAKKAEAFGFIGDALAARDDLLPLGEAPWVTSKARGLLADLLVRERRAYIGGRAFWPCTQLFFAVSFGISFAFGLRALGVGSISVGTLAMIYLYVERLSEPLEDLSSQMDQVQRMLASLAIAARTLAEPQPCGAVEEAGYERLPEGPLAVRFDGVTFGYTTDAPVLSEVTFEARPGQVTGIVGRTGAGKSTLVNLLCGLGTPQQGRVLIADVEASRIHPEEMASRISVLSQHSHLFSASIRDNLTLFGTPVPDSRIWEVLDGLGAGDWVRALPEGLDTMVGAAGRTVSEGEAQLLAGARALVRPSSLLVIDEGTSRLDAATERTWTRVVEQACKDRTVLMVAHRLATLENADQIVEMADGAVVACRPGGPNSPGAARGMNSGVFS